MRENYSQFVLHELVLINDIMFTCVMCVLTNGFVLSIVVDN